MIRFVNNNLASVEGGGNVEMHDLEAAQYYRGNHDF